MVSVLATLFQVLLLFLSFIMIVLVLLQRGRGGGLAGAFGGMGGQSAFGTKAGDVFTRITVVVAVLWVLSAGLMGLTARASQNSASKSYLGSDADAAASSDVTEKSGPIKDNAAPASPAGKEAGSTTGADAPAVPPPAVPESPAPPAASTEKKADEAAPASPAPKADPSATPPASDAATPADSKKP